jgi:ribosomal protein S18 acetylase RimI-like enzyme
MTRADIPAVQDVEREAGKRFADCDDPHIARCAADPIFTAVELSAFIERGHIFVATEHDDVVGFIVVDVVDGCVHIDEVAVAVEAGRRGHGTALVDVARRWAAERHLPAITLTTFRDVTWNGPWYRRMGFREVVEHQWTPTIRELVEAEQRKGLPKELRVVMRLDISGS